MNRFRHLVICAVFLSIFMSITESSPLPWEEEHCKDGEFLCVEQKSCIPNEWVCDSSDDCIDGSDEVNCTDYRTTIIFPLTTCSQNEGQFLCVTDQACIPWSWKCDGTGDCSDGSDEQNCLMEYEEFLNITTNSTSISETSTNMNNISFFQESIILEGIMKSALFLPLIPKTDLFSNDQRENTSEIGANVDVFYNKENLYDTIFGVNETYSNTTAFTRHLDNGNVTTEDTTLYSIGSLPEIYPVNVAFNDSYYENKTTDYPIFYINNKATSMNTKANLIFDILQSVIYRDTIDLEYSTDENNITFTNLIFLNTTSALPSPTPEVVKIGIPTLTSIIAKHAGIITRVPNTTTATHTTATRPATTATTSSTTTTFTTTTTTPTPKTSSTTTTTFTTTTTTPTPTTSSTTTTPSPCNNDEFHCRLASSWDQACIPIEWKCDQAEDCFDGSDESNCESACPRHMVKCPDTGQCIYHSWICDGHFDCETGSDELYC